MEKNDGGNRRFFRETEEEGKFMKKLISLILALTVILSACAVFTAAAADSGRYYVYTSNGKTLNLREGPGKDYKAIAQIPYGDEFYVSSTVGNGWSYGHWGGQFGYVMTRYLQKDKPGAKPTPAPETKEEEERRAEQEKLTKELKSEKVIDPIYIAVRATRTSGWINFRKGPSKTTTRLAAFPDGKELIAVGETTNWYKARDPENDKLGYIHKNYITVLPKPAVSAAVLTDDKQPLGTLNVNGEFNLTCKLPEGYRLEVVESRGDRILATVTPDEMTRPQMYLSIAYDEAYHDVERMNDMTVEELALLESTFTEMNQVVISYRETGHGTKLLIARENGSDTDFVDILAIYKGYFIEFNMWPNESAADQTLTEEQINLCIAFLTDVDFNEAQ